MDVKIKKKNRDGMVRLESSGTIKEIYIDENFKTEVVNVCFRGKASSGIITFTPSEIENMYDLVKKTTNLTSGFKQFKIKKGTSPL